MTPAEHYAEANRLVRLVTDPRGPEMPTDVLGLIVASAQVHATLATVPLFTATTVTESTP